MSERIKTIKMIITKSGFGYIAEYHGLRVRSWSVLQAIATMLRALEVHA